jgi:hypothetical protein
VEVRSEDGEMLVAQIAVAENTYQPGEAVHAWWEQNDELRLP